MLFRSLGSVKDRLKLRNVLIGNVWIAVGIGVKRKFLFLSSFKSYSGKMGGSSVDEDYEKAIKALNSLQSNAATIREAILNKKRQTSLEDTVNYLNRSGLTLNRLDHLSVIHVSGTKGKGSTCALTESILRTHGFKTGFFSSPHLVSVTERIRINGQPISKIKFTQAFWQVFNRLQCTKNNEQDFPAYFKFLTILSFHIFLEEQVDVAIVEVGIGGELDCTNIIRNTTTVGITSLDLEHTHLLGNTLEEIAWQKAGIIKPFSNVFTSVTNPVCLKIIEQRAKDKKANLYSIPDIKEYVSLVGRELCFNKITQLNGSLSMQLAYDWMNKKTVLLNENPAIISENTYKGLVNCAWPGRFQIVDFKDLKIHLDGAHTIKSMEICSKWFYNVTKVRKCPKILVFNATGERDSKQLLGILRRQLKFKLVCFVPNIPYQKRNKNDNQSAFDTNEQVRRGKLHAHYWDLLCSAEGESAYVKIFDSILDCFTYLSTTYEKQKIDILVTGSLHLVGNTILTFEEQRNKKN